MALNQPFETKLNMSLRGDNQMAASTKKRKKRMKRQLSKRLKQTSGTVLIVESIEPAKEFKAQLLYKWKYEVENQAYQAQLDAVYGGKVQPIERYINQVAILTHHCSECDKKFYSRPKWLLSKESQRHVCGIDVGRIGDAKRSKRYLKELKQGT